MGLKLVYIPAEKENAREIANTVLMEKLAVCCNLLPSESIYLWEGKIEEASETIIMIKTDEKLLEKLINRVKLIHNYDTPAIIVIGPESVNNKYSEYLKGSVGE